MVLLKSSYFVYAYDNAVMSNFIMGLFCLLADHIRELFYLALGTASVNAKYIG